MDLSGEYLIDRKREAVWQALNDPAVLARSIPGCESLNEVEGGGFEAVVSQAIGPVKARFKGKVALEDVVAPESYTLRGEGSGGPAGFAKGEARVRLEEQGEQTLLTYAVKASVGGQLSRIGQRLIDQAAKKIADEFFSRFSAEVGGADTDAADGSVPQVDSGAASQKLSSRLVTGVIVAAILAALLYYWF